MSKYCLSTLCSWELAQNASIPYFQSAHVMRLLFIKQLGLSEEGLVFRGGFVQSTHSPSDEVPVLSRRRADKGEVRLACMAPLEIPFAPRNSAAVMIWMAGGGGAGGAGGEGGGGQQSA